MKNPLLFTTIVILVSLLIFILRYEGGNITGEENQKQKHFINMEVGLHYDTFVNKVQYNITNVLENAKNQGYAIRIEIKPPDCKNPLPDGGCKGGDYIYPVYDYINVNFNVSDDYWTKESAWAGSPKHMAINGDRLMVHFNIDEGWVHILAPIYPREEWFIKFVPSQNLSSERAEQIINEELQRIGILSDSKFSIVFDRGYHSPTLE
ncbi:MAG: hypothetical protein HYW26_01705 [Candidatus Aenigmarchaeota archaeon]|nr:hypothetical protein [Candidatus Aenigmarchaeota archaeon]